MAVAGAIGWARVATAPAGGGSGDGGQREEGMGRRLGGAVEERSTGEKRRQIRTERKGKRDEEKESRKEEIRKRKGIENTDTQTEGERERGGGGKREKRRKSEPIKMYWG